MEDAEKNKLFVGGISWETTEDILKDHFGKYGTVFGSVIAVDRFTGNPRGFAFVSLTESSAVDRALQDSHQILGRTVCLLYYSTARLLLLFYSFFFVG